MTKMKKGQVIISATVLTFKKIYSPDKIISADLPLLVEDMVMLGAGAGCGVCCLLTVPTL